MKEKYKDEFLIRYTELITYVEYVEAGTEFEARKIFCTALHKNNYTVANACIIEYSVKLDTEALSNIEMY